MKKIITLLVAFSAFMSLNAQTTRDEARRVILGQPKNSPGRTSDGTYGRNGYPTSSYPNGSRQSEIDQVNRDYDQKIYSIRNNPNLTQEEKDRMIRQLERDRQRRINQINNRYDGSNNNDGYDRKRRNGDDEYDRKDNGKHLGWEKGVGNPHRNGGKPGKGYKGHGKGKGGGGDDD